MLQVQLLVGQCQSVPVSVVGEGVGEVQGRTPTQRNSTAQSSEQIMYRSVVQVNSERARRKREDENVERGENKDRPADLDHQ